MPKKKLKPKLSKVTDVVIEDPDLARTEVIAKIAIARTQLASAIEQLDEALAHFVDTSDDPKGEARAELIGGAEEAVGEASIALEYAAERMDDADTETGEEDEDEEDDEEDDSDEDDEDDEEDDDDDE